MHVAKALPHVPMPTRLAGLHPIVAALQSDHGRLNMPASLRRRSLLVLHGLTREASRRGYQVRECPVPERYRYQYLDRNRPGQRTYFRRDGQLNIVIDSFAYLVTITQESPNAEDDERWQRLVVSLIAHGSRGRQYNWYDRKRVTIDDRIAAVLHELETRAEEDRQREVEAARQEAERQREWKAAMARAHELAVQAQYVARLGAEADAWHRANHLRAYCDALELRIDSAADDVQAEQATHWLRWARVHIAATDPLRELPAMSSPAVTNSDLEPFLAGWHANGPEVHKSGRP
jgi:hypothetical protein